VVYFVSFVLADGVAGSHRIPVRVVDFASIPHSWHCGGWCAGLAQCNFHVAGPVAARAAADLTHQRKDEVTQR
jgi:hypothetical protein